MSPTCSTRPPNGAVGASSRLPKPSNGGKKKWPTRPASACGSTKACTPGYYNNEGKLGNPNGFFTAMYGAGPIKFFRMLDEWRSTDRLEGIDLS